MTSFYQSLTVNTEVSHVVYVRAEGAYLRNFSEIKKSVGIYFSTDFLIILLLKLMP